MGTINSKTSHRQTDFEESKTRESIPSLGAINSNDSTNSKQKAAIIQQEISGSHDHVDNEKKVRYFAHQILEKFQKIDPIVKYLQVKINAHSFERKYDEIIFVESSSILFSLLQEFDDTPLVISINLLYERHHENVHLPIYLEQMVSNVPCMSLGLREPSNCCDAAPVVWMKVLEKQGNIASYGERFIYDADSDSFFLNSLHYQKFIPGEYDYGIFGEKEIYPNNYSVLTPCSRSFKADNLAISSNGKFFTFTCFINKVAAIRVPWPEKVSDFGRREPNWPAKNVVKEMIMAGCHVVPKPSSNSREWTYEFSLAVMRLESEFTEYQKEVYLIFELLVRKYLCFDHHSKEYSGPMSYQLKTVMFWTCCEENETIWQENPLEGLLRLLKNLLLFLREWNCPDFFIPSFNLFHNMLEQKNSPAQPMFSRLTRAKPMKSLIAKLQKMINNLDLYLTDDILELKAENVKKEEPVATVNYHSPTEAQALRFLGDLVQSAMDGSSK